MARLLPMPYLPIQSMTPLSGPQTVGASAGTSIGNFTQTVASYGALWRWQFAMAPMKDQTARIFRGWATAMHGGANASRIHFYDPDMLTFQESGIEASRVEIAEGMPWSNGLPWSNGRNWKPGRPPVAVAQAAAIDTDIIRLADEHWGHAAGWGTMIGFFPLHFGMYVITEERGDGYYRIWPRLRKAITTEDFATLNPTLAMRLESADAVEMTRGAAFIDSASVTMVEVLDYDVRQYFRD